MTTDTSSTAPERERGRLFRGLATLQSFLLPERFLYNLDGRIRSVGVTDWIALMGRGSRHYRIRQGLVELTYEAQRRKATRALARAERRRAKQAQLRREEASHWHTAAGSACPVCGRASLHAGYCSGGMLRRHTTRRRTRTLVRYYD